MVENDKVDIHQKLMDESYDWWRSQEGMRQHQFIDKLSEQFTEFHKIAVILGNLNYQVCNGGFAQYDGNGYSSNLDDVLSFLEEHKNYDPSFEEVMHICTEVYEELDFRRRVLEEINKMDYDVQDYVRDAVYHYPETSFNRMDNNYYQINDKFLEAINRWLSENYKAKEI